MFLEGPDTSLFRELGFQDHICYGFWDRSPGNRQVSGPFGILSKDFVHEDIEEGPSSWQLSGIGSGVTAVEATYRAYRPQRGLWGMACFVRGEYMSAP